MYVGHISPHWCVISHLVHALWSVFALIAMSLMEVDLDLDLLFEADCDLLLCVECLEVLLREWLLHWRGAGECARRDERLLYRCCDGWFLDRERSLLACVV